jgi:hypothetical protein
MRREKQRIRHGTVDALEAIEAAIARAATLLEFGDLRPEASDEELGEAYRQRFHCGRCIAETVMTEVWPSIDAYLDWHEASSPRGPNDL